MRNIKCPQILITALLIAQTVSGQPEGSTVAVLDFSGRGIAQMEAQTLTDRLLTEIGNTGAVRLVERNAMEEILSEQGFQQTGCTSAECAAEVGALLGVEYMINGAFGKVGETYTIDAKIFSVESGATVRTKNVSYQGPIDGLITEIEILGWEILGLEAPEELLEKQRLGTRAYLAKQMGQEKSKGGAMMRSLIVPGFGQFYSSRKLWGGIWFASELTCGALAFLAYNNYITAFDEYTRYHDLYTTETDQAKIAEYKAEAIKYEDDANAKRSQLQMFSAAAAGVWCLNVLHAFISGPAPEATSSGLDSPFRLAYQPRTNQIQVRCEIAL